MAAGLGVKDFTTGEVLTAADVDGYLMQGIWVFASAAARDAAVTSPQEGNFAFTKDNNSLWYYDGAAWIASGATGDIEGVTAGIGISGGGTSGTVTITNSMATAIDAKGDLVAGTGADTFAKLTVGANDTVLTADSSTATGLKWAAAGGGGGGMTLLASGNIGATGLTLSSISGSYEQLFLKLMDIDPTVSTGMGLRFNSDTGSNYKSFLNAITTGPTYVTDGGTSTRVGMQYETFSTTANGAVTFLLLTNYADTVGYKQFQMQSGFINNPAGASTVVWRVGYWENENAITSINFFADAGGSFIDGGSYELWGIK